MGIISENLIKARFEGYVKDMQKFFLPDRKKYNDTMFLTAEKAISGITAGDEGWLEEKQGVWYFVPDAGWKTGASNVETDGEG